MTQQVDAYTNKTNRICVQAMMRYRDSFKRWHWTKVCAFHVFGTPLDNFNYCSNGNEVDEEGQKPN